MFVCLLTCLCYIIVVSLYFTYLFKVVQNVYIAYALLI